MKYELFPTLIKEYNVSGYPQKEKLLEKIFNYPVDTHKAVRGGTSSFHFTHNPQTINFLLSEGFDDLYEFFTNCSKDYSNEVGIESGEMFNAWFNIMDHGNETVRHHHPGTIIAGAYYPLLEDNSCNLIFYSPHFNQHQTWSATTDWTNKYNHPFFEFPIKQDHLYLFPGWLDHSTEINRGQKRVVISFNIK
jgi:uncharacterized protein (TIGR02466 family)